MNERDIKLAAAIDELISASSEAGYIYACWSDGADVTNEQLQESKDKIQELKKKLLDALNIRIV